MTQRRVAPKLALAIAPLLLGGCVTYPDITQSRSPCRMDPGGWCEFVREAAASSYGYAMLSSNAYRDEDTFTALGPAFRQVDRIDIAEEDAKKGFDYMLFDQFALVPNGAGELVAGERIARVLAFRGTDFDGTTDIVFGSIRDRQLEIARRYYEDERRLWEALEPDLPLYLTGHSLGGALATDISIENPGVKAWVFNSSPFYRGDSTVNDGDRIAISERGEFLRYARKFRAPVAADVFVINCSPEANLGEKHSIRKLAECLTWIAAYDKAAAWQLLEPNMISKPPVECGPPDKAHPGTGTRPEAPCVHIPRLEKSDGP